MTNITVQGLDPVPVSFTPQYRDLLAWRVEFLISLLTLLQLIWCIVSPDIYHTQIIVYSLPVQTSFFIPVNSFLAASNIFLSVLLDSSTVQAGLLQVY